MKSFTKYYCVTEINENKMETTRM